MDYGQLWERKQEQLKEDFARWVQETSPCPMVPPDMIGQMAIRLLEVIAQSLVEGDPGAVVEYLERALNAHAQRKVIMADLHQALSEARRRHQTLIGELAQEDLTSAFAMMNTLTDILEAADTIIDRQLVQEQARWALQLQTSLEVSQHITAALSLDELLSQVVNLVRERFDYYHVHIYLLDRDTGYMVMREGTGKPGRIMKERGHRIPLGQGLVGTVGQTGEPILVPDVSQEPRWLPNPLLPETRAELTVPLKLGEEVIGVLDVQDAEVGGLTEDDLNLMMGLGGQIAVAISNARLFTQQQRRINELASLNRIGQALSSTMELTDLLQNIYQQVSRVLDTNNVYIALYDERRQEVSFPVYYINGQPIERPARRMEEGLTEYVIRTGQPLLIDGDSREFCQRMGIPHRGEPSQSWLGVPMIAAGKVIGVIAVQNYHQSGVYDQEHQELLSTIAAQAAVAIQNARLVEDLKRRVAQLAAINQIGLAVGAIIGLDDLMMTIYQQVNNLMDISSFYIALYDEKANTVRFALDMTGGKRRFEQELVRPFGKGRTEYVIRTRKPLLLRDVTPEKYQELGIETPDQVARCYIGVPMIAAGKVVGVLAALNYERGNAYDESHVDFLTAVASQAAASIENIRLLEEAQLRVKELQDAYEEQARLAATVRELSTPVIQVWENVLVLPLIGTIDAARAARIMEDLLTGIVRYQAEMVILDLTGVPTVDTDTAHYLMQTIKAAGLLGAQTILVGIRSEMARTITGLGVEWRGIPVLANLRAGIEYALAQMNLRVVAAEGEE